MTPKAARAVVLDEVLKLKIDESSTKGLVQGIDYGDDETVSNPTKPVVKPNEMPYLVFEPISMVATPGMGQISKVSVTCEMTLWTPGWSSDISDRFIDFLTTTFLKSLARKTFEGVSVACGSLTRNYQGEDGPKVGLTNVVIKFTSCS